jgi:hypothetical protein
MPTFSFTEKEWDKVRPASVKKTGVSEAMRDVLKKVPKDLKGLADLKACDGAVKALDELAAAFENAEGMVKKAKDDKNGAAGKLKGWKSEVVDGKKAVEEHKEKLAYIPANYAAEEKMSELLNDVETAIVEAHKLTAQAKKDLAANKRVDLAELTKLQQGFRGLQRDARDVQSKGGFIKKITFIDAVHKTGLDPKKVAVPTGVINKIGAKADLLETEFDALGEVISEAIEKQSTVSGSGPIATEARKLLDEFKASHKSIKAIGAEGKKLLAQAKKAHQAIRASKQPDSSKLLAVIYKLHDEAQAYEERYLKESYRSRDSKGELQMRLTAMTKKEGFDTVMNQPFRDWRAAIFDVVRLCTLPSGAIKDEIDEALEYVKSFGGASADQAQSAAKRIAEERRALGLKYGSTGA